MDTQRDRGRDGTCIGPDRLLAAIRVCGGDVEPPRGTVGCAAEEANGDSVKHGSLQAERGFPTVRISVFSSASH